MSRKFNYKTERYNYLWGLVAELIMGALVVIYFSVMCVIGYICNTGDCFTYMLLIFSATVFVKLIIYPCVVYSGSSLYDITLYKDRFEIKRVIKNITIRKTKTIYYKDIVSLTELSPILGMYVNNKIEDTVLEIKLKNKKNIYVMLTVISKEKMEDLMMYFENYTGLSINFDCRFILKFK